MAYGYDDAYHDGRKVTRDHHESRRWSGTLDNPDQSYFNKYAMLDAQSKKRDGEMPGSYGDIPG